MTDGAVDGNSFCQVKVGGANVSYRYWRSSVIGCKQRGRQRSELQPYQIRDQSLESETKAKRKLQRQEVRWHHNFYPWVGTLNSSSADAGSVAKYLCRVDRQVCGFTDMGRHERRQGYVRIRKVTRSAVTYAFMDGRICGYSARFR